MSAEYHPGYDAIAGVVILATALLVILQFGEARLLALIAEKRRWALRPSIAQDAKLRGPPVTGIWSDIVNFPEEEITGPTSICIASLTISALLYAVGSFGEYWGQDSRVLSFISAVSVPGLCLFLFYGFAVHGRTIISLFTERARLAQLCKRLEESLVWPHSISDTAAN